MHINGIFVSSDHSDPLNSAVDVGPANEYLTFVQDKMSDRSLADLDPLNQMLMLEEMDPDEAQQLLIDLYRKNRKYRKRS